MRIGPKASRDRTAWPWEAVVLIGFLLFSGGCSTVPPSDDDARRLAFALTTLSPVVDPVEAQRLARLIDQESNRLAAAYRSVETGWLQNVLVNTGLRERGLCYHWVNDLMPVLEGQGFRSLQFHRVGSKVGTRQEHHALVVSAYGDGVREGLRLDPWKRQGRLEWMRVRGDLVQWHELVPEPTG